MPRRKAHVGHHRKHPDKCPVADCTVTRDNIGYNNWGRHCRRHPRSKHPKTLKRPASGSQLSLQSAERLTLQDPLAQFLATEHPSLHILAQAWRHCVDNLQLLGPGAHLKPQTSEWHDSPSPLIFPAEECWIKKPMDRLELLDDIMHNYDRHIAAVYMRGEPHEPVPGQLARVIEQLLIPSVHTCYSINLESGLAQMRAPERLANYSPPHPGTPLQTTINMTPKYTQVDLHIDPLSNGITTTLFGCTKLWAFWPLTRYNADLYKKAGQSKNKFLELYQALENGSYAITTDVEAVYIPPGYLHATYTLEGGLTPGITYISAQCVKIAALAWEIERDLHLQDLDQFFTCLQKTIEIGLQSEREELRKQACHIVCQARADFRMGRKIAILEKAAGYKELTECTFCGARIR